MWNTNEYIPNYTRHNFDFSAGLIVNYKHLYIGSSVFHVNQPVEGFQSSSKLPYRLSIFVSYNLPLGENVLINMTTRLEQQQNFNSSRININALFIKHFMVGLGLLSNNAIATNIGYKHNYFTVSILHEFGTFSVGPSTAGSYELAASFTLRKKDERKILKDFERW